MIRFWTSSASPRSTSTAGSVQSALHTASETTGVSFDYLLKTAKRESSLDPTLKSKTSTATGLFQFLDSTWLGTLKADGAKYGYGQYAEAIQRTGPGRYQVSDPVMRQQIMALREDATANAVMAGAFTTRNAAELRKALGRQPNDGELYVAHFFGPAAATKFLQQAQVSPSARADTAFPEPAAANRPIFYDKAGRARSNAEVYAVLVAKHGNATTTSATATSKVAPVAPARAPVAPIAGVADIAPTAASSSSPALGYAAEDKALPFAFRGLFQTERTTPIAAGVQALWAPQAIARASAASGSDSRAAGAIGSPLELASFLRPQVRAGLES